MSRTCSVSMWLMSSFRTNSEYASREASGAMSRTSMPDASRARSVRRSVLAKRARDTESRSARSASSGLTVSTQQSVTLESSSIEGSGDTLGLGLLHDSRRGCDSGRAQLSPEQNAEAGEQWRDMQRGAVDGREVGRPGGNVAGECEGDEQEGERGCDDDCQRRERRTDQSTRANDGQRRRAVPEQVPVAQHQIGVQQGAPPRSVVEMQ